MYPYLMRSQHLEARVLDIVEAVVGGGHVEDDRVELKSEWPTDHRRAARQIAGLANANGGEPILWIIGLDEKRGVTEFGGDLDPATWWGQVQKHFSEVWPEAFFLRVPTPYGPVFSVHFDTSRTPYLVNTRGQGGVHREVPWREGSSTRTALRSELLRSVVAQARVPIFEVHGAAVRVEVAGPDAARPEEGIAEVSEGVTLEMRLGAYLECVEPVRLPEHRWSLKLTAGDVTVELDREQYEVQGPVVRRSTGQPGLGYREEPAGSIRYVPGSGLHIDGSDAVRVGSYHTKVPDADGRFTAALKAASRLTLAGAFPLALSSREAQFVVHLRRRKKLPMYGSGLAQLTYEDLRVGEFVAGTGKLSRYDGQLIR